MEMRTTEEARQNVENFAKRLLELQQQKKVIDQDIKALKEEFKEEGVPVGIVNSLISKIKADMKKSDGEKFEAEVIREWLETNKEIENKLAMLNAKD